MKNAVIIPFQLPWNWSADYQRQTALELVRRGHTVIAYLHEESRFFLKPLNTTAQYPRKKGLVFYRPVYFLPGRRFALIELCNQWLNMLLLRLRYRQQKMICWVFDPYFLQLSQIGRRLAMTTLYDCVDYHPNDRLSSGRTVHDLEKELITNADYFFTNSYVLQNLHQKTRLSLLVPQGFDLRTFRQKNSAQQSFPWANGRPTLGYVGGINLRLNYSLLMNIAKKNPQWNLVLWGPFQKPDPPKKEQRIREKLLALRNVHYGESSRKNLAAVLKTFNIGIIPYDEKKAFDRYSYPMKLFEYFYFGKPVISSPLPELKRFPRFIALADSPVDWEKTIKKLLRKKMSGADRKQLRALAIRNSWEKKVGKILAALT